MTTASLSALVALGLFAACSQAFDESGGPPGDDDVLSFRGRLIDRDTLQPIGGAKLRRIDGEVEVVSGDDGRFAFPIRAKDLGGCSWNGSSVSCSFEDPETTRFFVIADGSSPLIVAATRRHDWSEETPILVWRAGSVHGIWLDADGRPVADGKLEVSMRSCFPVEFETEFTHLETTTDSRGAFRFDAVPARIRVSILPAPSDDEIVVVDGSEFELAASEDREITLRSDASRRLHGVVRDAKGRPLAGAGVWVHSPAGFLATDADEDGAFVFEDVARGEYELKALHPQEYRGVRDGIATTLLVGEGEGDLAIDLFAQPLQATRGRLLDAVGQPIDGEIWFDPETMPYEGRVDVEADGAFVVRALHGMVRMCGSDDARLRRTPVREVASGSNDVQLSLEPSGRILGRVTGIRADMSDPTVVELLPLDPSSLPYDLGPMSLSEEADVVAGEFRFPAVPCGLWVVRARSGTKLVSACRVLTIVAGAEARCENLELEPAAELILIGRPGLGDVTIELQRGDEILAQLALPSESAAFVRLPHGSLRILAHRSEDILAEESVKTHAGGIEVVGVGFAR